MENETPKVIPDVRIFVNSQDVQIMTGTTRSTACRILQKIRKALGLEPKQPITIFQYCGFYGINEKDLRDCMKAIILFLLFRFEPPPMP